MSRFLSIISLILIFISLALVYVIFADLSVDKSIVIRLDPYRKITFLGDKNDVLKIAVIGFSLVLINIFLGTIMEKRYKLISHIMIFGTVLLAILILVVIGGIIVIN